MYCGILLVLAVFQDSVLRTLPYSQYFGVWYSEILLYLKYFGVRYSGIIFVLEVFKDPVLLILRVLAVFRHLVLLILSILGVFRDFILRGAVILSYFMVLYCKVLLVRVLLGVFYSNADVFRGLTLSILGSTPSILDFCTAGTACTRAYVLLILPALAVFGPSVLLILQVLRVFMLPVA